MDPIIIHIAEVEEGEVAMCYARGEAEALKMKVKVLVAQSRPTLCDPMSCITRQAPLSMGFSRQEYWSGLPFSSPGNLPNLGVEPGSPALQANSSLSEPLGKHYGGGLSPPLGRFKTCFIIHSLQTSLEEGRTEF